MTVLEFRSLLSFQRWKKLPDELQRAMIAAIPNPHLNCLAHSCHDCTALFLVKRFATFRMQRRVCRLSSCARVSIVRLRLVASEFRGVAVTISESRSPLSFQRWMELPIMFRLRHEFSKAQSHTSIALLSLIKVVDSSSM